MADKIPPKGHTKALIEAISKIQGNKLENNRNRKENMRNFISFWISRMCFQSNVLDNITLQRVQLFTHSVDLPNQLASSSLSFKGLFLSLSASSVIAGKPKPIPDESTVAFAIKLQAIWA